MNHYGQPTKEQIEAARGHFFVPGYAYPVPEKKPLRKLTQAEEARVAKNRADVHAMGADAVAFVSAAHKDGLIDGWRNVGEVVLFNEGKDHGTD